jgi:hypothetical protein
MLLIKKHDYRFLEMSYRFCRSINDFVSILKIDEELILSYQLDSLVLDQILLNLGSYSQSLETYAIMKIECLKPVFRHIVQLCRDSQNYNRSIGILLGIELDNNGINPVRPN